MLMRITKFSIKVQLFSIFSVGQGAYGIVAAALDTKTQQNLAIKKIEKLLE